MRFVNELWRDSRFAVRVLLKSPVATAVAILALALGIGVNASSFLTIDSLILHPFPFHDVRRLMTIAGTTEANAMLLNPVAPANFLDLQRASRSFSALAAYRPWEVALDTAQNPERVSAFQVTSEFFPLLSVKPERGRWIAPGEDRRGQDRVVVVSQGFWKSHLAAQPAARSVRLGGERYTVIGVMPDEFDFPLGTDIWAPLSLSPGEEQDRKTRSLRILGRLAPGVSVEMADAETTAIATQLARAYPSTDAGRNLRVKPLLDMRDTVTTHFVLLLLGAAGFVLLLACTNIGNLQLARASARQREIAVRTALGASRGGIARQLLVESVIVSLAAGAVGLLLASWNNAYARASIPELALRIVPGLRTMHLDLAAVALTFAVALVAGALCSVPAIVQLVHRRMRIDLTEALRERTGSASVTVQRSHLRGALIVFELVLALVLLVGAGLMVRTFERLLNRDQGFDPRHVLTLELSVPSTRYSEAERVALFGRVLDGVAGSPRVSYAAVYAPLGIAEQFSLEGRPELRPEDPRPERIVTSSHYLAALRIPLLAGRNIAESDRSDTPRVALISQNLARYYWPHTRALGQHIRLDGMKVVTIVGVTGNVTEDWFTGTPSYFAYVPYTQLPPSSLTLHLRTPGNPLAVAAFARERIRRADPQLAVGNVQSMEQAQTDERHGVFAAARAMTTYAVIALLLAATGIYAVVSYLVASRTHDIGVRMALGASRADVLKLTMSEAAKLTAIGLGCGIPLAAGLAHFMSSVLYGVVDVELSTFLTFGAILVFSALLASYVPAYRATRIDPLTALRDE